MWKPILKQLQKGRNEVKNRQFEREAFHDHILVDIFEKIAIIL